MSRENELSRAIENAGLPPREYRIFGALLRRRARWGTAEILPRWQPSLADLARLSAMSKPTLLAGLDHLEKHGWVTRVRSMGGQGHRTAYQLAIGASCDCPGPDRPRPRTDAERARSYRRRKRETVKNFRDGTVKNLDRNCQASRDDSAAQGAFRTKEGIEQEREEEGMPDDDPWGWPENSIGAKSRWRPDD